MRLRQIEVFHAVYSNGSISAAARALNVSQPSVSKVLRHTEDQLGITLFTLVRGRLLPTDEAHALFREVDEVFHRISSLQQTARNLRGTGAGHLRLGVVPSLGHELAPRAVTAFRAQHPEVTFDIQTLHHNDMIQALYERECDLAIGYDPPAHPRMATHKLATAELLVVSPRGTFDRDQTVPIDELEQHDIIGVATSGPVGDIAAAAFERAGVSAREVVSVGTYYIAAALARFGCGVALVDEFTAWAIRSADLDIHRLQPRLRFVVQDAWLEDRPLSALAERFVTTVSTAIAKERRYPAIE